MATITLRIGIEEMLIEAGVERRKWSEFVNESALERLMRIQKGI